MATLFENGSICTRKETDDPLPGREDMATTEPAMSLVFKHDGYVVSVTVSHDHNLVTLRHPDGKTEVHTLETQAETTSTTLTKQQDSGSQAPIGQTATTKLVTAVTQEHVDMVIGTIAPEVNNARQWYAVYRVLVDKHFIDKGDFGRFVSMVRNKVPNHKHLPDEKAMSFMATGSFTKPVRLWDADNAPVRGKRFFAYQALARRTNELYKKYAPPRPENQDDG